MPRVPPPLRSAPTAALARRNGRSSPRLAPRRSSASARLGEGGARDEGVRKAERNRVARLGAKPGQRKIDARMMGEPRQEVRSADVGKQADADLGHGEDEAFARDAMRRVDRDADAPAHHDAVDQRDDRLRIGLDAAIELIFLAPEGELLCVVAGAAEIVQMTDVAAGAERLLARAADDDPRDAADRAPTRRARPRSAANHGQRQRVERLRPVQDDDARRAAPLDHRLRAVRAGHAGATSDNTASIALATSSIGAMPSTRCRSPRSR